MSQAAKPSAYDRALFLLPWCIIFALPMTHGVWVTAIGLGENDSSRYGLGIVLIVVGLTSLECLSLFSISVFRAEFQKVIEADLTQARKMGRRLFLLNAAPVFILQLTTINMFFLTLDGHVHFRAACWLFLAYGVGTLFVLAIQRFNPRAWGARYLRLAWAPIVAFGVPLALPTLRAAGLAPFDPLP